MDGSMWLAMMILNAVSREGRTQGSGLAGERQAGEGGGNGPGAAGGVEADQLVDGRTHQAGALAQRGPDLGMVGQGVQQVAERGGEGGVAALEHHAGRVPYVGRMLRTGVRGVGADMAQQPGGPSGG